MTDARVGGPAGSRRLRVWLALALAGGVSGAACDQIHVQAKVLAYPHATVLGQAWWVGPQFGVAVVAMVLLTRPVAPRLTDGPGYVSAAGWFLGAYVVSGLAGNRYPVPLAAGYAATWLMRIASGRDRWLVASASIVLAAGGVAYEGTLAGTGAFHYLHPADYNVPVWLAGIYLHGAPLLLAVTRGVFPRNSQPG